MTVLNKYCDELATSRLQFRFMTNIMAIARRFVLQTHRMLRRTGQHGQKNSQRRYISPSWEEAPTEPMCTKICTVVDIPDKSRGQSFELKFLD